MVRKEATAKVGVLIVKAKLRGHLPFEEGVPESWNSCRVFIRLSFTDFRAIAHTNTKNCTYKGTRLCLERRFQRYKYRAHETQSASAYKSQPCGCRKWNEISYTITRFRQRSLKKYIIKCANASMADSCSNLESLEFPSSLSSEERKKVAAIEFQHIAYCPYSHLILDT